MRSLNNPWRILKHSFSIIFESTIILQPLLIISLVHVLLLEVLYFYPRYPLVHFFGPIVKRLWHASFLHYPNNFILLPKLFFYSQVVVYLFLGAFLTGVTVKIIQAINDRRPISLKKAFRETLPCYLHIFIAAALSLVMIKWLSDLYQIVYRRADAIRSVTGLFGIIKRVVMDGMPFFNLLIALAVTVLFVFVIPAIVIQRKKIHHALATNFKLLWRTWLPALLIILVPMLLYVPMLILRLSVSPLMNVSFPEGHVFILLLGIVVTFFIDAVILTSTTTLFLLNTEQE